VIGVDASALIELLLNTDVAPRLSKRLFDPAQTLHAPHLIDVEVTQVLRRYERAGSVTGGRAEDALQDRCDLPIARYPHDFLLGRVWALRRDVTAYDAVYLALAEALGATIVTRDSALASASGHNARVEVIR
jgi:predicted nucleic acid-binding protein